MSLSLPQEGGRQLWILPQEWGWPYSPFVLCSVWALLVPAGQAHGASSWARVQLGEEAGDPGSVLTSTAGPLGHAENLTLAGSGQKDARGSSYEYGLFSLR